MIIDLTTTTPDYLDHFKGGEGYVSARTSFDGMNRILHGTLLPGHTIGMHTHDTSSEVIYVISGIVHMVYDGADEYITAGNAHYCPKGHTHMMMNDGPAPAVFFAVVPEQ